MQINFQGEEKIGAAPNVVADFIRAPEKVAKCIPDSKEFEMVDRNIFKIKIGVKLGFLNGTFDIKGSIKEEETSVFSYSLEGGGFGSSVKADLSIGIFESAGGAKLAWKANFLLEGVISGMGEGTIRRISEEKIEAILKNLKEAVEKGNA